MRHPTSIPALCLLWGSLSACNSGGSSSYAGVVLTDLASESISSFVVDIDSIHLENTQGELVSVLDGTARVDLAGLVDLGQVFSDQSVGSGRYAGARLVLDWTEAEAWLEGEDEAATLLDAAGNPLGGTTTIEISFPGSSFDMPSGSLQPLQFDVNLNASADVFVSENTIRLMPTVVLTVKPPAPKLQWVAGGLLDVDLYAGTFYMTIESPGGTRSDQSMTCMVDDTLVSDDATVFHIDGIPYDDWDGLVQLDDEPAGTYVQAHGYLDTRHGVFGAIYVEAGRGTLGGGFDAIDGLVVAREGLPGSNPILQVLGHAFLDDGTPTQVGTTFTVFCTHASTSVVEFNSLSTLSTDAVNVGQRIVAFGELSGAVLNASSGIVRLWPTKILGTALGAPTSGRVNVSLSYIGLSPEADFEFEVSGVVQLDPDDLRVSSSAGFPSGTTLGTLLQCEGYVSPVTQSSFVFADFGTYSVVNRSTAPSWLFVSYEDPTESAFALPAADQLTATLTGSIVHEVDSGLAGEIDLGTSGTVTAVPTSLGNEVFCIVLIPAETTLATEIEIYSSFSSFASSLGELLVPGGSWSPLSLRAHGTWANGTKTQTSTCIIAILSEASDD